MWFLGIQLALPEADLPLEMRARGLRYWEARLAAAKTSKEPDAYRDELSAIGLWCGRDGIDNGWLYEQLLRMLEAGFIPESTYSIMEWLTEDLPQDVDKAVAVLFALLTSPVADRWTYISSPNDIRSILESGFMNGTNETKATVAELVSFLASENESSYLDITAGVG